MYRDAHNLYFCNLLFLERQCYQAGAGQVEEASCLKNELDVIRILVLVFLFFQSSWKT
jgi:hypothetical protein